MYCNYLVQGQQPFQPKGWTLSNDIITSSPNFWTAEFLEAAAQSVVLEAKLDDFCRMTLGGESNNPQLPISPFLVLKREKKMPHDLVVSISTTY